VAEIVLVVIVGLSEILIPLYREMPERGSAIC